MSVSVNLLTPRMAGARSADLRSLCFRAESAGIDGVGFGDHVSFFTGAGSDGLIGATTVLTASDVLDAIVAVYLLPLRHPVPVARQIADLAALAPGRLTFGVGIGGEDPQEVENCGVDPRTRGRRMDECLQVLRSLLAGGPVDFDGEFITIEEARIEPAPAVPVPILVGGRSDAAVRRTGQLGDGWLGVWASSNRFEQVVGQVTAAAEGAGREEVDWQHALNVWVGIGPTEGEARSHLVPAMEDFYRTPFEAFERWCPAGPPDAIAEFLAPYVEAGCGTFNIITCGASLDEEINAVASIRSQLAT